MANLQDSTNIKPDDVKLIEMWAEATSLCDSGRLIEAVEHYRKAIDLWPGHVNLLYNYANLLDELCMYDEALLVYDQLLTLNSRDYTAQNDIGTVYSHLGLVNAAEDAYRKSIAIEDNAMARRNLACLLQQNGNLKDALMQILVAAKLDKNSGATFSKLGTILSLMGNQNGSIKAFRKSLTLLRDDPETLRRLSDAYRRFNMRSKALRTTEILVKRYPTNTDDLFDYGLDLLRTKRYRKAQQNFRRVLQQIPGDPLAWSELGKAYEFDGNAIEAERCYREGLRLEYKSARLHNDLGVLLTSLGRLDEARKELKIATSLDPPNSLYRANLAHVV